MINAQLFTTLLGVAIGLGGLWAYFAKSKGDSIIAYQATEIELRDGTIARLKEELAAASTEVATLREQNTHLKELAQGSPQLQVLADEINKLPGAIATAIKSKNNRGKKHG